MSSYSTTGQKINSAAVKRTRRYRIVQGLQPVGAVECSKAAARDRKFYKDGCLLVEYRFTHFRLNRALVNARHSLYTHLNKYTRFNDNFVHFFFFI